MKEILDLRLYTVSETADLLATNAAAVRRYIKAGALRAAKIGAAQKKVLSDISNTNSLTQK